jgi:hypothetical protein
MLSDGTKWIAQLGTVGILNRMRVLLYGMQSSGASVLALTLAQKQDCLAFVDIWNMFAAPELEANRDVVAKVVVTTAFSLEVHRRRFRPDVTLLVLRHPADTYDSLVGKSYANEGGLIDEKFAVFDQVFRAGADFDDIAHYEDFVFSPRSSIALCDRIGWRIDWDALLFRRTQAEIQNTNTAAWPAIHERLKYGCGNTQTRGVLRDRVKFSEPSGRTAHLKLLCPSLFEHYSTVRAERGELWHVPCPPLLSCSLDRFMGRLTKVGVIPQESKFAGYTLRLTNGTPHCRVGDTALTLHPAADGRETCLTVSGLPGLPFNRVSGTAYSEHPHALGTCTRIRIEGEDGECLAEREFSLCHSDMRLFDLAFEARSSAIALSLGVRLADGVDSAANSGVSFQDLRLEQLAM